MKKQGNNQKHKKKKVSTKESPLQEPRSLEPSSLSGIASVSPNPVPRRGTGTASAGQSGDLQGLPRDPDADSLSVEELIEEGQFIEADIVSGVEEAADEDEGEVQTHETP